ncbi:MAG: 7TM diverse intracellular signaling domain-containing protein [Chitinophagaceae bacterium]
METLLTQTHSMNRYTLSVISLFLIVASGTLYAQDTNRVVYTDISKITLSRQMPGPAFDFAYTDPAVPLPASYPALAFQTSSRKKTIPVRCVTQRTIVRFQVCNTADTAVSVWFFPGIYFRNIRLYRVRAHTPEDIPSLQPDHPDGISYRLLSLPAHDSATILAELTPVKTYLNKTDPQLISLAYLDGFVQSLHFSNPRSNLITYVFCGLLLMMVLYSLSNYFQDRNREFLYYSAYAFFLGLMLFLKAAYSFHTTRMSFFQEEYLDYVMQSAGHLFYIVFMQQFLLTRTRHPFLHRLYQAGIVLLVLSVSGYSWFHFFSANFVAENAIENFTKLLLLAMAAVFLVYSFLLRKDRLLRYLFRGNLCLLFFSLLSQIMVMSPGIAAVLPGVLRSSLFYYEIGLFLELVFFLAGLNYKHRTQLMMQAGERERLRAENQMKEYEKELAVFKAQQEERERISADMHDELGSGMTAIRLMSEIARNKMKQDTPVEIDKISHSADEVLNKMNAIIWSMNSDNDTVDNLVFYIRAYAQEYFENTPMRCIVRVPHHIENKEVSGDKRRNVFLCVKETLNNAVKHSRASEIRIDMTLQDTLDIRIADNGVGIDMDSLRRFGNGLKNIAKRMESIGGSYRIENCNGTLTVLSLPL